MKTLDGRRRVTIERVRPQIDGGRFPIKRVVDDEVTVEADIFVDGHEVLRAVLKYRLDSESTWQETAMEPLVNDGWRSSFRVDREGTYLYTVEAWVDQFGSWHRDFRKRVLANQAAPIDLQTGAQLVEAVMPRAEETDRRRLEEWVRRLRRDDATVHLEQICEDPELVVLMDRYADRGLATTYEHERRVVVDRKTAGFSAWYEMFPRSVLQRTRQARDSAGCRDASALRRPDGF